MITAYLFPQACPPIRANVDKAEKVSVKTAPEVLAAASAEERLRCSDCLEAASLVHRGDRLNHFRHHPRTQESPPCRFRSDGRSQAKTLKFRPALTPKQVPVDRYLVIIAKLRQELEQARKTNARLTEELEQALKLIAHLTEEAHQAEEIIRHVEDGLKAA